MTQQIRGESQIKNLYLDNLEDTNAPTPEDQQFLKWDNTESKWIASYLPAISVGIYYLHDELSGVSTYESLLPTPANASEDIDTVNVDSGDGQVLLDAYASEELGVDNIETGQWEFVTYVATTGVGTFTFTIRVYKRTSGGTETELFNVSFQLTGANSVAEYDSFTVQPDFAVNTTDRLIVKYYVSNNNVAGGTASLYYEGNTHYSHIHTPFNLGTTTTFLGLNDTPNDYTGQALKIPRVNLAETGLEFATVSGVSGASTFLELSDTPNSYSGYPNNMLVVSTGEDELVLSDVITISGNNVGINTANPDSKLHVSGGNLLLDNDYDILFKNNAGSSNITVLTVGTGDDTVLNTAVGNELHLAVSQVPRLMLRSDGNIVITNNTYYKSRNAADNADILLLGSDTSNNTILNTALSSKIILSVAQVTQAEFGASKLLLNGGLDLVLNNDKGVKGLNTSASEVQLLKIDTSNNTELNAALSQEIEFKVSNVNKMRMSSTTLLLESGMDLYNVAWTDYSGTSTISGWSSRSETQIWYKKVGKLVFVHFRLYGISNAISASFTLPYAKVNSGGGMVAKLYGQGGTIDPVAYIANNSSTVNLYDNAIGVDGWASSGVKEIMGQFWYEATT